MKRRITPALAVAVLACTSLALVSCSSTSASQPGATTKAGGSIAYFSKDLSLGYFQLEGKGVTQEAKQLGYTAKLFDDRTDASVQASNLQTAINEGVKAIVFNTVDQKLGPVVVAQAKAAHIPLISIDDPILDSAGKPVPFVGQETTQTGQSVGDLLTTAASAKKWDPAQIGAAAITYNQVDVCKQRTDAATSAIKKNMPQIPSGNFYQSGSSDNESPGGLQAMQGLITAHPNVQHWLVYGCNEEAVVGGIRALEGANKATASCGVGLGPGDLGKIEFAKGNVAYCGQVFVDSRAFGVAAVKLLHANLTKGTKLPTSTLIQGTKVTSANWKQELGG